MDDDVQRLAATRGAIKHASGWIKEFGFVPLAMPPIPQGQTESAIVSLHEAYLADVRQQERACLAIVQLSRGVKELGKAPVEMRGDGKKLGDFTEHEAALRRQLFNS